MLGFFDIARAYTKADMQKVTDRDIPIGHLVRKLWRYATNMGFFSSLG